MMCRVHAVSTSVMSCTTQELCEQVCDKMAVNSDIIIMKGPVKESNFQFQLTPADLTGDGMIDQSHIYLISRPMLWIMRLLGRLPYSFEHGKIDFLYFFATVCSKMFQNY